MPQSAQGDYSTPQVLVDWLHREALSLFSLDHQSSFVDPLFSCGDRQCNSWDREQPSQVPSPSWWALLKRDSKVPHFQAKPSFQASDMRLGDSCSLGLKPLYWSRCCGPVSHRCPMTLSQPRAARRSLSFPVSLSFVSLSFVYILDYIFFSY